MAFFSLSVPAATAAATPPRHSPVVLLEGKSYRRLLRHTPLPRHPAGAAAAASPFPVAADGQRRADAALPGGSLDANVVMILAVLLCALICALGINSLVRYALRCSGRPALGPAGVGVAARGLGSGGVKGKGPRAPPALAYSAGIKLAGASYDCAICLSEFAAGEPVRVLPECNHGFHVLCIDRWLAAHSSCPTCRQCLYGTCHKASGCPAADGGADDPSAAATLRSDHHPR